MYLLGFYAVNLGIHWDGIFIESPDWPQWRSSLIQLILTAEVEVDGGADFTIFIFGFNFVKSGVWFYHIVQFKYHSVCVFSLLGYFEGCSRIILDLDILAEPSNVWLGAPGQLALEDQTIAVILLPQLRLLHKRWGHVLTSGTHAESSVGIPGWEPPPPLLALSGRWWAGAVSWGSFQRPWRPATNISFIVTVNISRTICHLANET